MFSPYQTYHDTDKHSYVPFTKGIHAARKGTSVHCESFIWNTNKE